MKYIGLFMIVISTIIAIIVSAMQVVGIFIENSKEGIYYRIGFYLIELAFTGFFFWIGIKLYREK